MHGYIQPPSGLVRSRKRYNPEFHSRLITLNPFRIFIQLLLGWLPCANMKNRISFEDIHVKSLQDFFMEFIARVKLEINMYTR